MNSNHLVEGWSPSRITKRDIFISLFFILKQNKIMANPSTVQMRKIVLSELCACFASKSHMTKQELLNSIKRVEVSQSLYKWLLDTGILSSSKGKGASVSLAIS